MKVLNLRCDGGHGFEGWFASEDDYANQRERGLLACPLCGDKSVLRLPTAPRLNLSGAQAPAPVAPPGGSADQLPLPEGLQKMQVAWLNTVREVMKNTEDVGERFPEEARKIHYGEAEVRGIRGQATSEERAALSEEGIAVMALPIPEGLKGPTH
ncbi:MAG: DUF1178 family protein [Vitreoscilla sp.]|nr:DUF1178 family protein [Vitreoscilla sp.]MBP6673636.1 DUF1178 family protein [Vitreoscilla sp.]